MEIIKAKAEKLEKFTPIFTFDNAKDLGLTDDGQKILEVLLSEQYYDQLQICTETNVKGLKSKACFNDIGLPQFIGFHESNVFAAYPEMKLMIKIGEDEKGKDILERRLIEHSWLGQKPGDTAYFAVDSVDHEEFKAELKSTKEINIVEMKLKPNYEKIKKWSDKLIEKEEQEK